MSDDAENDADFVNSLKGEENNDEQEIGSDNSESDTDANSTSKMSPIKNTSAFIKEEDEEDEEEGDEEEGDEDEGDNEGEDEGDNEEEDEEEEQHHAKSRAELKIILKYVVEDQDKLDLIHIYDTIEHFNSASLEKRKQEHGKCVTFIEKYIDSARINAQFVYKKRKDKNQSGADLGEHAPTLGSLYDALQLAVTSSEHEFLLESYLYIHKRSHTWAPLYIFTTNSYKSINPAIATKDFSDADVKTLYEIFTDIALPRLKKDIHVTRCIMSHPGFDVAHVSNFSSYQLTSTTLEIAEGICLESKGDSFIAMHLTCNNVPALFLGFDGISHNTWEREVVLCPGLRFVWDKTSSPPPDLINSLETKSGAKVNQTKGHYVGILNGKRIYARNYTARLMDNPILEKFPIEARTKNLMAFFQYVNTVYQKIRHERVQKHVTTFVNQAKAKVESAKREKLRIAERDKLWSIKLNQLLFRIQHENLEKQAKGTAVMQRAEKLVKRMFLEANTIYLPWDFTFSQHLHKEDHMTELDYKKLLDPLRKHAPSVYKLLRSEDHDPTIPSQGEMRIQGRTLTLLNEGHSPFLNSHNNQD